MPARAKIRFEGMHFRRDIGAKGLSTATINEDCGDVAQMDRASAS